MFEWLVEQYAKSLHHHLPLSLVSIVIAVLLFRLSRPKTSKLNIPPSPSGLPIIGNLHQLGSLPHRTLRSLAQKHGPLMMLHFGQAPTLIVSSATAAKEILKTQDLIFSNRPKMISADRLLFSSQDIACSPYGDYWRQVKKIAVLQLLSAQRVESFRAVREEEVDLMVNNICQSCSSTPSVVNLSEMIVLFTNNVTCRVAFGRKYLEDIDGLKFGKIIKEFMYLMGFFNVGDFIPWLAWVNNFNGYNAGIKKIAKDLDCFLESVIEEHIQAKNKNDCNYVEDFVDVLLGIEEESSIGVPFAKDNVKALIMDIFVAGTDTISSSLVWAMTELITHVEIMKQVQTEIREIAKAKPYITEDDLGEMNYLKMVIKETLRLHLPAPLLVPHESMQDTKLQGYDIPAKTRVVINAWAIGRDPTLWEEPEEFQPTRFLNNPVDYKGFGFEYLPFGAGRRGCPGTQYSIANIELPLANLLYHFDWTLPDGTTIENIDVFEGTGVVAYKKVPLLLAATPYSF